MLNTKTAALMLAGAVALAPFSLGSGCIDFAPTA